MQGHVSTLKKTQIHRRKQNSLLTYNLRSIKSTWVFKKKKNSTIFFSVGGQGGSSYLSSVPLSFTRPCMNVCFVIWKAQDHPRLADQTLFETTVGGKMPAAWIRLQNPWLNKQYRGRHLYALHGAQPRSIVPQSRSDTNLSRMTFSGPSRPKQSHWANSSSRLHKHRKALTVNLFKVCTCSVWLCEKQWNIHIYTAESGGSWYWIQWNGTFLHDTQFHHLSVVAHSDHCNFTFCWLVESTLEQAVPNVILWQWWSITVHIQGGVLHTWTHFMRIFNSNTVLSCVALKQKATIKHRPHLHSDNPGCDETLPFTQSMQHYSHTPTYTLLCADWMTGSVWEEHRQLGRM